MRQLLPLIVVAVVIFALTLAALALGGKKLTIDTSCYFHFGDGCVPGKPYKIEDR